MHKGVLIDLDIMRDAEYIRKKAIVVWGAGDKGRYVLKMLKKADIRVAHVCDSNADLWGIEIEDNTVLSPFMLRSMENKEELCVIFCTIPRNNLAIHKTLGYIMDGKYEFATYFGIVNMFRFHYETMFQDEAFKCAFRLEKEIGQLEYQQRYLRMLNDINHMENGDIIVLQPGKVGSSSVRINLAGKGRKVYHIHHIHFPVNLLRRKHKEIWEGALERLKSRQVKIITGVREPISRDFSALFQAFDENNRTRRGDWLIESGDIYRAFDQYVDMILYDNREMWSNGLADVWGDEFLWFDQEIKAVWGIDIYEYPFDREKGYSVIHTDKVDIFLYKSEKLNAVAKELYQFALGYQLPDFVSENRTDVSWRNEAYQEFKRNVVLKPEYVSHYYKGNQRMDHFYTDEEKGVFLKKWEHQIAQNL